MECSQTVCVEHEVGDSSFVVKNSDGKVHAYRTSFGREEEVDVNAVPASVMEDYRATLAEVVPPKKPIGRLVPRTSSNFGEPDWAT